jgi:hypothetical protein
MTEKFRMVTDELLDKVGAEDLAAAIGCSVSAIKQARMAESSPSYRRPPPGWERGARKLALARAAALTKLADKLNQNPRE